MNGPKIPVTVVVPVKNEEANLDRCLSRLTRFEETIVVDSSSTDRTPQIAELHGAKLINFQWNGQFPKKRNWLLSNHELASDWVLFLDADEMVTEAFCRTLAKEIESTSHQGYWLNYINYFLGRPLRHGIPQRKLALFRVGAGLYERIDEKTWSQLDMEVHEHPVISGTIGEIHDRIDHKDDRGIAKFIERHRDYALWEAHRIIGLESTSQNTLKKLTARQQFKYRNIRSFWYPYFYFTAQYFLKLGFLDGRAGFQYALCKAWYFNMIQLIVREMDEAKATNSQLSKVGDTDETAEPMI